MWTTSALRLKNLFLLRCVVVTCPPLNSYFQSFSQRSEYTYSLMCQVIISFSNSFFPNQWFGCSGGSDPYVICIYLYFLTYLFKEKIVHLYIAMVPVAMAAKIFNCKDERKREREKETERLRQRDKEREKEKEKKKESGSWLATGLRKKFTKQSNTWGNQYFW